MGKNIKINYNNTFSTSHSRDYYRGQSFHFSGEWMIGSHYKSDDYVVDFVVHDQVLLACAKSHLSTLENEPINFIRNNSGTIIGVNSNCWDFIMAGIVGKTGKVYFPTYDDTTGKLTWDLISEEDIDESDTSMYIPMALADLKDDADHRLVTDDEKNAWNDLINQISNLNINKADKADLDDYVKKINNPFAVGSGTQSAFQKNPEHPNTASGNSSVAIGADNEATKIGSFAANRKNHATGDDSNATGYGNTASGDTSHAEGHYTTASGKYSHTEGHGTTASNDGTHAEGWNSKATGDTSHAEGHGSVAGGARSHAEGKYTKTSNDSEHAQGMYNKSNTGTLHSIGIGTSDANRKNAVEVLNNGNVYITGIGNYDGTNPLNDNSLQSLVSTFITKSVNNLVNYFTKTEVTNLINSISQFHYEVYHNIHLIQNPQSNVLYLVGPKLIPGEPLSDKYEEYVYSNNDLIKIGDTSIDLSGYVTTDALNAALANYILTADIPIEKGSVENSVQQKNTDADASGEASVAFNMGSASGEYSFAEGYGTRASGDNSHAEGEETFASGPDSHAEGGFTIAFSRAAHVEGSSNIAGAKGFYYLHGENDVVFDTVNKTITLTLVDHQNGTTTVEPEWGWISGNIISIVNDGKYDKYFKIKSRSGPTITLELINQNAELPFTSIITPETVRADDYSIINLTYPESGNIDFGATSHAEGMSTCAINMYAHSEGYTTEAYGQYSHAEGRETEASYAAHAEGRKTKAFGAISHAEGNSTVAEGYCAHVEGQGSGDMQNRLGQNNSPLSYIGASGEKSHAEGTRTNATGHSSHAEGFETFATGNRAHSEGYFTQANASDSHAEGNSTIAQGTYSHAEGVGTNASGSAAHAEGQGTGAMQNRIGENNTALPYLGATGDKSHTEGTRTSATMNSAHAEGFETFATANRSHAEGGYTQAKGIDSHAEGYSTIATNQREHAEGQFNVSNLKNTTFGNAGNTIHSVGIGTNADNRKNAIEIMQNGDAYLFGLGGYDGTNPDTASTLKQVIDAKGTYIKPSTGIPASDLAAGIIPEIEAFTTEELDTIWLNSI